MYFHKTECKSYIAIGNDIDIFIYYLYVKKLIIKNKKIYQTHLFRTPCLNSSHSASGKRLKYNYLNLHVQYMN